MRPECRLRHRNGSGGLAVPFLTSHSGRTALGRSVAGAERPNLRRELGNRGRCGAPFS
jgi:hypothetical protein